METVSSLYIRKMFDSIIIEKHYDAAYTTIHHCDCNHTFGGTWNRKYSMGCGYYTGAKYYVCPNCGTRSEPYVHKVILTCDDEELFPKEMFFEVVNCKDFLDLRIKYKGIQLFWDGTSEDGSYKEVLRFDFKASKAFYIDEDKRKHELTVDYIREYDNPIMPILKYIGKSYAVHGVNKEHLAKLFKSHVD